MKKLLVTALVLATLVFVPSAGAATATGTGPMGVSLTIEPTEGPIGSTVSFTGTGGTNPDCQSGSLANVYFVLGGLDGQRVSGAGVVTVIGADASFSGTLVVPSPLDVENPPAELTADVELTVGLECGLPDGPSVPALDTPPIFTVTGPGPARSIDDACPPEDVPDAGFTDVADGDTHAEAIDCIAWYEITTGTTETTYSPGMVVPRDQMASFIARLIDHVDADALGPVPATEQFPCASSPEELPEGTAHYDAVQRLAANDIVLGGPRGMPADCYGPGLEVTRAQMASFIHRAEVFLGHGITATADYFSDDDGNVHEDNINALAEEAITVGYADGTYRPGLSIERDQMASFLARKLDYLVDAGATEPPPVARAD